MRRCIMPAMARRSRRDERSNVDLGPVPRGADTPPEEGPSRSARKRASDELQALGEQARRAACWHDREPGAARTLRGRARRGEAPQELWRPPAASAVPRQAHASPRCGRARRGARRGECDVRAVSAADRAAAPSGAHTRRVARERHGARALARGAPELASSDAARLRALIREARKDASEARPGEAPRRGRAYREIFAIVRARLERV